MWGVHISCDLRKHIMHSMITQYYIFFFQFSWNKGELKPTEQMSGSQ